MSQVRNLKQLFPGVSCVSNIKQPTADYIFYAKFEMPRQTFFFEVHNSIVKKLVIKLYDEPVLESSIVKYGAFNLTESVEILKDLVTKETTHYFPPSFDIINLSSEERNKFKAIIALAICCL